MRGTPTVRTVTGGGCPNSHRPLRKVVMVCFSCVEVATSGARRRPGAVAAEDRGFSVHGLIRWASATA